ncbi:MAG: transcription termination/antitermination protein NusG [Clostridia bacterium]|nr:transcription termination/antitermination protein NusG [Clostridia bacterium]
MEEKNEPQWYVIYALFGYDNIVKDNILQMVETNGLQNYIFDVVVPEEEEVVERNGKKKFVMRKKYPNYVFIKMIYTKQIWYMVKQTRGVKDFCSGFDGRPLPMTAEEVKRAQLEQVKIEDLSIAIGDNVTIISGPLKDFIGEIKEIKEELRKVKVCVSMFGRETSVDLDYNQVEKIN